MIFWTIMPLSIYKPFGLLLLIRSKKENQNLKILSSKNVNIE